MTDGPSAPASSSVRQAFLLEASEILLAEAYDRQAVSTNSVLVPGLLAGAHLLRRVAEVAVQSEPSF